MNGVAYAINDVDNSLYEVDVTAGTASRVSNTNLGGGTWDAAFSGQGTITINEPPEGMYVPDANRLTLWRQRVGLQYARSHVSRGCAG